MVSVTPNTSPREISDSDSRLPSIWKKVRIDNTRRIGRKNDLSISSTGNLGKRLKMSCFVGSTQRQITQSSARYCRYPAVTPRKVNIVAASNNAPGTIRWVRLEIRGLLNLRLVWNDGAAFSLFSNGSTWLGWISLLVSIGLLVWIWRSARQWSKWQAAAAALLLAGSLGNGLDRWRYGAVIDGLELVPISFPVFNLADVAINLAVLCLLIEAIRQR